MAHRTWQEEGQRRREMDVRDCIYRLPKRLSPVRNRFLVLFLDSFCADPTSLSLTQFALYPDSLRFEGSCGESEDLCMMKLE